jgi:hypothetical protein
MRKETAESPKDGVLRSQAAELNLLLLDQAVDVSCERKLLSGS